MCYIYPASRSNIELILMTRMVNNNTTNNKNTTNNNNLVNKSKHVKYKNNFTIINCICKQHSQCNHLFINSMEHIFVALKVNSGDLELLTVGG